MTNPLVPEFDIATQVTLSFEFRHVDTQALVDPAEVTCYIKLPDGSILTRTWVTGGQIVHDSTGKFHYNYLPSLYGVHWYRGEGIGGVPVGGEQQFIVKKPVAR